MRSPGDTLCGINVFLMERGTLAVFSNLGHYTDEGKYVGQTISVDVASGQHLQQFDGETTCDPNTFLYGSTLHLGGAAVMMRSGKVVFGQPDDDEYATWYDTGSGIVVQGQGGSHRPTHPERHRLLLDRLGLLHIRRLRTDVPVPPPGGLVDTPGARWTVPRRSSVRRRRDRARRRHRSGARGLRR